MHCCCIDAFLIKDLIKGGNACAYNGRFQNTDDDIFYFSSLKTLATYGYVHKWFKVAPMVVPLKVNPGNFYYLHVTLLRTSRYLIILLKYEFLWMLTLTVRL